MRTTPLHLSLPVATLFSAGIVAAQAAGGLYYDPSNVASLTGSTIGHELYRTIGCPARELLGKPCPVPMAPISKPVAVPLVSPSVSQPFEIAAAEPARVVVPVPARTEEYGSW